MTEFALVAPVLLLLTFGIIDFGRALYFYAAAGNAAREAARVAAVGSNPLPTNSDVITAAAVHFPGASFSAPACVNGPPPPGQPAAGTAWLTISSPSPPIAGFPVSPQPANAPGGEIAVTPPGCFPVVPAVGFPVLEVRIAYNFAPVTPLVSSVIGGHVVFILTTMVETEY